MKLMATLFILLLTVTPSFAEPDPVKDERLQRVRVLLDSIKPMCLKTFPDNMELARRCASDAEQRWIDTFDEEQKIEAQQHKERILHAQRELYRLMDQAIQEEREIHRQQHAAQIDAARIYRDTQLEAAQMQAAGMILQGFAFRPLIPTMQPYTPPPLPAFAPFLAPRSLPPISCSTNVVGGYAHTDCY